MAEDSPHTPVRRKRKPATTEALVAGILAGQRPVIGQAITLIESSALKHRQQAQPLLDAILPHSGQSLRIGITGIPGVGKSTFIETLGLLLCKAGHRVAVLAVDPTSTLNGGSILGDKTRMQELSAHPHAFIRPSPSSCTLGGVARKTRETIYICEAAGYDIVLVETVGVGQSEVTVRSMVDCFLLLALPGAGDDLQGIKKGIMELADMIVVNKADGNNLPQAKLAANEYEKVLQFLQPATTDWHTSVLLCSAMEKTGLDTVWDTLQRFQSHTRENGTFQQRRKTQNNTWFQDLLNDALREKFLNMPAIQTSMQTVTHRIESGKLLPTQAVEQILKKIDTSIFQCTAEDCSE